MNDTRIGKIVRWADEEHFPGRWFTARIAGKNTWGGYTGEVVDPGNFSDEGKQFTPGEFVPNMRPNLITESTL